MSPTVISLIACSEHSARSVRIGDPCLSGAFALQNRHVSIAPGMSLSTLMRHFRAALGATPAEYLRTIRLRHAAEMLINTQFSLQEIAVRCGFQSDTYFFRTFKKEYHVPPLQFRRAKKGNL